MAGVVFAAPPVVNLHPASNITQTSATLSLAYTSSTPVSVIMFEYSTDPSFGSNVTTRQGTATSINISGLTPGTRYYYRAMVTNTDGPTTAPAGGYYFFDTSNYSTPYVETLGETNVASTSLTLTGRVNTYGQSGTYFFRYYTAGCSSLIGTTTTNSLSATTGTQNVSAGISGLSANTTYCAELVATIGGTTYPGGKVAVKTSTGGGAVNQCVITSFYASPSTVVAGNSATLIWNTTNCTSATLSNVGSVNTNGSQSVAPGVTTSYTLTASNGSNTDTQSLTVTVTNSNNPGNNYYPIPSCYYNNTCYWNGSAWVNYNTTPQNYPVCYYSNQCYYNGSTWVYYSNYNNQIPPCYSNNMCYQQGNYWYYYQSYVPAKPVSVQPYAYNPHTVYTGGPTYVYKQAAPVVKTVYVDQPVQPVTDVVAVAPYPYPQHDLMAKYYPTYDNYTVRDRVVLTGSAGSTVGITLIGLLIALVVIGTIVYLVRSSQARNG